MRKTINSMPMYNQEELASIKAHGLEPRDVDNQIRKFENGFKPLDIVAAATAKNGIKCLSEARLLEYVSLYESSKKKKVKFVPASGAASRMFKKLYEVMDSYKSADDYEKTMQDKFMVDFCENITKFAFYNDLQDVLTGQGTSIEECLKNKQIDTILKALLTDQGLNYGKLPKGLLKFHKTDYGCITPFEEHLIEGATYAASNGSVNLHFTVSDSHKELFEKKLQEVLSFYSKKYNCNFEVSFSVQKPETDTIAVDENNKPVKNADGSFIFRPGGHGALIANLSQINAEIVFVKNIDNVVQDRLKDDTILYKKAIAGMLISNQNKVFDYLNRLDDNISDVLLAEIEAFLKTKLLILPPAEYPLFSKNQKISFLRAKLNRPMRVCGMVINEGEPGGGPFWVKGIDGSVQLQILESTQIPDSEKHLLTQASHFNPVDLVCSTVDYKGNKFDLTQFVDQQTGFISSKSVEGKTVKALELPGLWNGAMSDWITLFVEVPASTFNPVKTVNDLLRDAHQ